MARHALSIDFESWVHACSGVCPDRGFLPKAGEAILRVLKKRNAQITFFVAGQVYEWYPELVKEIGEQGHEIGYHTHSHMIITSKGVLEEQIGLSGKFLKRFKPGGFRAPQCTITRDCFPVLERNGFEYDSSSYGPLSIAGKVGGVLEIPVSTMPYFSRPRLDFPRKLSAGLFLREFPFGTGLAFSVLGSKMGWFLKETSVLFVHPWQLCSECMDKSAIGKSPLMRMYFRNRMGSFERLLEKHEFMKMEDLAEQLDK